MEDKAWRSFLTSSLRDAWRDRLFTDLVIVTADEEQVHAHRLVLTIASPYFRALLSSDFSECRSGVLRLEGVRAEILTQVLDYIYSGLTSLSDETAAEVLSLADYLQVHDLKRLCCRYIKAHLTPTTSLQVYELALLRQCHDLAQFALQMAIQNCSAVIKHSSFLSVQAGTVAALLKQQILHVSTEDELFKAVLEWISYEKERSIWYPSLLSLLNADLLDPLMRAIYLEEVMEHQLTNVPDHHLPALPDLSKANLSRHKKKKELLMVLGGESSGRILGSSECFSLGYSSWSCSLPSTTADPPSPSPPMEGERVIPPMREARSHAALACRDNVIFLIGGQSSNEFLKSCETFCPLSNEWGHFAPLPVPLHGAGAAFLGNQLYVAGGRTEGGNQNTLLMYDEKRNSWVGRAPMLEGRAHFGVGAVHECLYAVGGLSGGRRGEGGSALDSCEKYDAETDKWTPVARMAQRRAYHGVATIGDAIFAIGGFDGSKWLNSVERYDPLKDQWTHVCPMVGFRSSFGVSVSQGRIYCMGGFSGEAVLNTVEKYNPGTDSWHCVQSTRLRRYALVAGTLHFPEHRIAASDKFGPRKGS